MKEYRIFVMRLSLTRTKQITNTKNKMNYDSTLQTISVYPKE